MASQNEYIVLDIETTGLNPAIDSIIEIAMLKIKRGLIVDEFSTLINPGIKIPEMITELTGINNDDILGQPSLAEVMPDILLFIGERQIVAHNASFDSSFLRSYLKEDNRWLDSITLAQIAFPKLKSYSLNNICDDLSIINENPHRAIGDARATAKLFMKCIIRLSSLDDNTKSILYLLSSSCDEPLGRLITAETKISDIKNISEVYLSNKPTSKYKHEKKEVDEEYSLDSNIIDEYLKKDGLIKQKFDYFENRPQQLEIARKIAKCFNQKEYLLMEAGTGTGKSLAYLLPSILFSLGSGQKVAISTYTINLQEQLIKKDIPQLREILESDFDVAVLKGRANYLCLTNFLNQCQTKDKNILFFLMRIAVWLSETNEGDSAELSIGRHERWKWELISASAENCIAPQCKFCNNRCFVQMSRDRGDKAHLIIINHSLLLADAVMGGIILPTLPYLIIDEAHHLPKVAEDQLSYSCDFYKIIKEISVLKRRDKGNKTGGLLDQIRKINEPFIISLTDRSLFEEKIEKIESEVNNAISICEEFFLQLYNSFYKSVSKSGYYPLTYRITDRIKDSSKWQSSSIQATGLSNSLNELQRRLYNLWEYLSAKEVDIEDTTSSKNRLKILSAYLRYVKEEILNCFSDDDNHVVWLEFSENKRYPSLCIAPVEIGERLGEQLFSDKESIVFTSATLTATNNSFKYYKNELGLDQIKKTIKESVLTSPFFYQEQALTAIANDLPNPTKESEIIYNEAVSNSLVKFIAASRGRAMVLFTSHSQLKYVYERIREPLAAQSIKVLAHNISGSPNHLLERLKKEKSCCILGASSFWEGIDVIGEALSLVVIVRLPFWPPDSPIMASRLERLETMGRNSFREYSLPQAIIRFKQGFGRLIRSEEDSGVFLILDRRILENSYGRSFIKSLPEMEIVNENTEEITVIIKKILK